MIPVKGYTIQKKIYESASSLVWRATRNSDNRPVILKILKEEYPSPYELARYRQEYEIASGFNTPGVIKIYGIEKYENKLIIIFEDFSAESLRILLPFTKSHNKFALKEFLENAIRITSILGEIHAANVIHKDINPSNIVMNVATGQIKIIDFGISTVLSREIQAQGYDRLSYERPNKAQGYAQGHDSPVPEPRTPLEGTLAYISPEQTGRMNRSLDFRTDFYSLGVTFYEILCGRLPFETHGDDQARVKTPMEMVHCHLAKEPPPPCLIMPSVPLPLSDIIMRLMAKDPEKRYQSAFGIRADLQKCSDLLLFPNQNKVGSIENFQIGTQDLSDRFLIPQKLYGREREIETLLNAFDRICDITDSAALYKLEPELRTPQTVKSEIILVSGHAGIGKSALVREIHKPLTLENGYFITSKFDQFKRNTPYYAIIDAFSELMQQILAESEESLAAWGKKLSAALGPNAQIIIDVIPELELIISDHLKKPQPEREKAPDFIDKMAPEQALNRFNLAFQNFMAVFISPEHPLVIFLDDLQWADTASLKLIQGMIFVQKTNLLLIGAFRDNEVDAAHPLMQTMDELRKSGVNIRHIELKPLQSDEICQLVAETLHQTYAKARPLAEIVYSKTGGNPFFINVLLKSLYDDKLIDFDPHKGRWNWSLQQIRSVEISDNVVELTASRIKKLSRAAHDILTLAACIGNRFTIAILAYISEQTRLTIRLQLQEAVAAGLIFPLSDTFKLIDQDDNVRIEYKFAHDQIQQAAYSMIPKERKQAAHRRVGLMLLRNLPPEECDEKIFDIVDQLNLANGPKAINNKTAGNGNADVTERRELVRLNYIAGNKAKHAAAYTPAYAYYLAGIELSEADCWETDYHQSLNLWSEAAEAAYLCNQFDKTEHYAAIVLEKAETVTDRIKVYEVCIMAYIAQNNFKKAISTGISVLNLLGVRLPPSNTIWAANKAQIVLGLGRLKIALAKVNMTGRRIENLIDLPEMTDPAMIAAMRILMKIGPAAYISDPLLLPLIHIKRVLITLRYGNMPLSADVYVCIGIILCGVTGEIDSGCRFGELALRTFNHFSAVQYKARLNLAYNGFVGHWKAHLKTTLKPLKEGYQSGLETGDLEYAVLCISFYLHHAYVQGRNLRVLRKEIIDFIEPIIRLRQEQSLTMMNKLLLQITVNLADCPDEPCLLCGDYADEKEALDLFLKVNFRTAVFTFYFEKLALCYLFEDYNQALAYSIEAEQYSDGAIATVWVSFLNFYNSLTRLALYNSASKAEQKAHRRKVRSNQKKMKKWAHHAHENYLHKWKLVEAELARVADNYKKAAKYYDEAVELAETHEYLNDQALALELAGKFYLDNNHPIIAKAYLRDAHYIYQKWGADTKVIMLEKKYAEFFYSRKDRDNDNTMTSTILTMDGTLKDSGSATSSLDIESVMLASQTISGEIILSALIKKMMRIVIENSGAEKAFFIMENKGSLFIEAETRAKAEADAMSILKTIALESAEAADKIPASIIHYVARTFKDVVIDNASDKGRFAKDEYVLSHRLKSILCTPLVSQGQLRGVLYLENNLAAGAFTPERVKIMQMLTSQVAISVENAGFYKSLKKSEKRYRSLWERAVEGIFQSAPDGRLISANPSLYKIMGYDLSKDTPSIITDLAKQIYVNPEHRNKLIQNLITKGQVVGFETAMRQKDGTPIQISVSARAVKDAQGNLERIEGSVVDISERIAKEKADRERKSAEAANRAKSEFLANMSHEIRTPMNAVLGFTELLDSMITDPKQREYLSAIKSGGKGLLTIINDILDLSKIEAGKLEIQYEPVNPHTVFMEIENIFSLKASRKNLEFKIEIDPSLPQNLILDEVRVRQILFNLVGNAFKFTSKGYIKVAVRPIFIKNPEERNGTVFRTDDKFRHSLDLAIAVEDTGIGIPEKDQKSIFESFKQQEGQSTRKFGGTGLGLTICTRLAEMMDGSISVTSTPGQGSVFEIRLRDVAVAEDPAIRPDDLRQNRPEILNIIFEPAELLVVDDVASNRDLIKSQFMGTQIRFLCAENGEQAVRMARQYKPALILMDILMPVMDGYEATRRIKADNELTAIPIVAITASAMAGNWEKIEQHGFDGCLRKPVSRAELYKELARFLKFKPPINTNKHEKPVKKTLPDAASPETVAGLPELIVRLERELIPQWNELQKKQPVKAVQKFGHDLEKLGKEYNIDFVTKFGADLIVYINNFDIRKMRFLLSGFPELIDQLKTRMEPRINTNKHE